MSEYGCDTRTARACGGLRLVPGPLFPVAIGATVQPEELHSVLEPVYVPALMNLIDERNLEFLRRSLTASDFRKAQRERESRASRVCSPHRP